MKKQEHRSWPVPSKNWIMRQTWKNVFFAHWPILPERLRPSIPSTLEIETYQQMAWLGVVIFEIEGIYFRGLSPISVVLKFPEVNLRTYVQHKEKPGVFFLSLDVANWASLSIAKRWYHLPYCKAKISYRKEGNIFHCQSVRKGNSNIPITFKGSFTPDSVSYFPEEGTIDHWLTERSCLYSQDRRGNIYCGDIHHKPWPLQKATAEISNNTLPTPFGINISEKKPILHFSNGVDTLFWNIKKD
jgi:uncharacterized protein